MQEYQLEIKQIVDYPRCRIYRQFIRALMEDRSIRVSGGSGLFYFVVLSSYANFRTSYRRLDGISYTIRNTDLEFSIDGDRMEYVFTCEVDFFIKMFGSNYPVITQEIRLTGYHNTKF